MKEIKVKTILLISLFILIIIPLISIIISDYKHNSSWDEVKISTNDVESLEYLKRSSSKLGVEFPNNYIKAGMSEKIFIKVTATSNDINCLPGQLENCDLTYKIVDYNKSLRLDVAYLSGPGFKISNNSNMVIIYYLNILNTSRTGKYILELKSYPNTNFEESKVISFNVENK
jgi:hypothetical protein